MEAAASGTFLAHVTARMATQSKVVGKLTKDEVSEPIEAFRGLFLLPLFVSSEFHSAARRAPRRRHRRRGDRGFLSNPPSSPARGGIALRFGPWVDFEASFKEN